MTVDVPAVERMVLHHLRLGINGLFVAGTCGEGPWLPLREKSRLVVASVEASAGRLPVAVQVSDNSAARVLENIEQVARDGGDIVVVAPPMVMFNADPKRICNLYAEVVRESPLPVGFYDLGSRREFGIPISGLEDLLEDPKVIFLKDSSSDPHRRQIALRVRSRRSGLGLFNGDEFNCVSYLQAGYDGLMLGGAVAIGQWAKVICEAVAAGRLEEAEAWQRRMSEILYLIYGGKSIGCWLAGLKELLVGLGVFGTRRNFPDYDLTEECRQAVASLLEEERAMFLPDQVPVIVT